MAQAVFADVLKKTIEIFDPKQLDDSIFNVNVLTRALNAKGRIESLANFYNAPFEWHFQKSKINDTIKNFQNDTTLDFKSHNITEIMYFYSKSMVGTTYIPHKVLESFKKRDDRISLNVKTYLNNMKNSIIEQIEKQLWSSPSELSSASGLPASVFMEGLKYYFPSTGADAFYTIGTIGGLNRADYDLLQHWDGKADLTAGEDLKAKMDLAFRKISKAQGIEEPDFIIMDPDVYDKYNSLADDEARSDRSLGNAELSWVTTTYKGKPVTWADALEGTGLIYMLNTNYITFYKDPANWLKPFQKEPYNQLGMGYGLLCVGNLVITNLNRHAVIKVTLS